MQHDVETILPSNITFTAYLEEVSTQFLSFPTLRLGQAYFNVLYRHLPYAASTVIGTKRDPFYFDSNLDAFCAWLQSIRLFPDVPRNTTQEPDNG